MRRPGWSRQQRHFQSAFSAFLRSVGLDALNVLKSKVLGSDTDLEPKKYVKTESLSFALQRCAVHLLPCVISILVATINLQGYFIGFELAGESGKTSQYIALLQIAAKTQELLIIASLTTVVVHRLRHDLIDGEGVPFGLVGAGSLFSQLSYFWSTAFIGSVSGRTKLNATLVGLVLLAGLIALTVGPAIAVLLIPREQTWPAGGTTYWINGSSNDLWPLRIGLEHYMPEEGTGIFGVACSSAQAHTNPLCPAGGYLSFLNRFSSSDYYRPWSGSPGSRYTPVNLLIWSPLGQVPPYNMVSAQRARVALESSAIGIHGPVSWVAVALNEDWQNTVDALPNDPNSRVSRYRYYSTMRSIIDTWVPSVRVVCSELQYVIPGKRMLQFPVVQEFERAIRNRDPNLTFDDQHTGEPRQLYTVRLPDGTLENLQYTQYPRVSTVDFSNVSWTTATTGIIIERPWSSRNETLHEVSSCIVDARWAKGAVSVGLGQPVIPEIFYVTKATQAIRRAFMSSESYRSFDMFRSDAAPRDSLRRIYITPEWLHSINLPLSKDVNTAYSKSTTLVGSDTSSNASSDKTTLSSLIALTTTPNTFLIPAIEHTLAAVFADALARAGSWRVLNVTRPVVDKKYNPTNYHIRKTDYRSQVLDNGEAYENPSSLSPGTFTEFRMRQEITGYAFKTSSITDILALVVVFLYLLVALCHTILLLVRRTSSSCWDSVPELLALTQQSNQSTFALRNTAAGIERMSTFRQRARIRVSDYDSEHVELIFDTDYDDNDVLGKPQIGEKYR